MLEIWGYSPSEALDSFIIKFFSHLLHRVRNFKDPAGNNLKTDDLDIVHLYFDNAGLGFTFYMDYAGIDRDDFGWITSP